MSDSRTEMMQPGGCSPETATEAAMRLFADSRKSPAEDNRNSRMVGLTADLGATTAGALVYNLAMESGAGMPLRLAAAAFTGGAMRLGIDAAAHHWLLHTEPASLKTSTLRGLMDGIIGGGTLELTRGFATRAGANDFATGAIRDLESPSQRATRLGLADDFEQSKELFFAQAENSTGGTTEVVVRKFDPALSSDTTRLHRLEVDRDVNAVLSRSTGIDLPSLRFAVREKLTLPNIRQGEILPGYTNGSALIQEYGGKQFGMQLKEWANIAAGQEQDAKFVPGSVRRFLDSDLNARAATAEVVFDNMWKGNIDLTELSQQTIMDGSPGKFASTAPRLRVATVDPKNNYSLAIAPSWGFGSQYGLTLDVAKALENKRLFEVAPQLQERADRLLSAFESDAVRGQLVESGLTNGEIAAARLRLNILKTQGFPQHLGEMTFTDEEGNISASLSDSYSKEQETVQKYLGERDLTRKVTGAP